MTTVLMYSLVTTDVTVTTPKLLPLKNIQPCGNPDHHIHIVCKIETDLRHNKVSCDQETISPDNKDSVHKPCSSCHQPVTTFTEKLDQVLIYILKQIEYNSLV